jgi:hypothetical protein
MRLQAIEEEREEIKLDLKTKLRRGKNKREISYPDGYWDKDIVYQLDVQISNEQKQKQAFLETRSNLLVQYLQYRDLIRQDPSARKIFEQLVEAAGMSSFDFDFTPTPQEQTASAPMQPQQQQKPSAPAVSPAKPQ